MFVRKRKNRSGTTSVDGLYHELGKLPHSRLIVGYTQKRAKKDKYNREKGIKRLKTAYKSGTITKENINKRDYNKFLELSDDVKVEINQDKINGKSSTIIKLTNDSQVKVIRK